MALTPKRRQRRIIGIDECIAFWRFLQEHYSVGIGSQAAFRYVSHTVDARCGIAKGEANGCALALEISIIQFQLDVGSGCPIKARSSSFEVS